MRDETTLFLINLVKSKLAGLQMDQITLSVMVFNVRLTNYCSKKIRALKIC